MAQQLEMAWEENLLEQRRLREAHDRFQHELPRSLTSGQIEAVQQLAQDLPALWNASTTSVMDRKELVRAVIERIVLRVLGRSEQVEVTMTWAGSCVTQARVSRPVQRAEQLSH